MYKRVEKNKGKTMDWDGKERRVVSSNGKKENGDTNLLGELGSMFITSISIVGSGILNGRK